jgi:hypothetical protein
LIQKKLWQQQYVAAIVPASRKVDGMSRNFSRQLYVSGEVLRGAYAANSCNIPLNE